MYAFHFFDVDTAGAAFDATVRPTVVYKGIGYALDDRVREQVIKYCKLSNADSLSAFAAHAEQTGNSEVYWNPLTKSMAIKISRYKELVGRYQIRRGTKVATNTFTNAFKGVMKANLENFPGYKQDDVRVFIIGNKVIERMLQIEVSDVRGAYAEGTGFTQHAQGWEVYSLNSNILSNMCSFALVTLCIML